MVFEDGQHHLQRKIPLPMGFLMARRAEGDQILGDVTTLLASRLNVMDLSAYSQSDLDAIALRLNTRPRQTLGFRTPADKLQASVASTP